MKKIKFSSYWHALLIAIYVMSGVFFYPNTAYTFGSIVQPEEIQAGDLVKKADLPNVWYIDAKKQRRGIPNGAIAATHFGTNYGFNIKVLPANVDMDAYFPITYPAYLGPRPGTMLLKSPSSPRVYAVVSGMMRRHLKNPETARALYGADWEKKIVDVNDSIMNMYTVGPELDGEQPHDGQIVRPAGTSDIYFVNNGTLQQITNASPIWSSDIRSITKTQYHMLQRTSRMITSFSLLSDPTQEYVDVSIPAEDIVETPSVPSTIPDNPEVIIEPTTPSTPEPDPEPQPEPHPSYTLSTFEQALLNEINTYRTQNNLNTLVHDDVLYELAKGHNEYMIAHNEFEHTNFDDRFDRAHRNLCAENLAWNYSTATGVLNGWINSPGHHANLIRQGLTHAGISKLDAYVTFFACSAPL